jgi:peptide/nickel transport system ATP-binding protein
MAICIALEPDLIIADEPTTALDVTIQRVILQTLSDLRNDFGVTLILISHDMGVHAQLADRVAVMYEGRIVEVGDTRQIFKDPQDPYTRALIESIPTIEERKAS